MTASQSGASGARARSPWEDPDPTEDPVWSDVHDVLWDCLTSFDMHGTVAAACARYIVAESGLTVTAPSASGDEVSP